MNHKYGVTWVAVGFAVLCVEATALALPVPIASTGFESTEGYTAGLNLRSLPGDSFPMPDGTGWGNNNWAGDGTTNGAILFMPLINDPAKARSGDQYAVIHGDKAPSAGDIRIRRKYDTSLIQESKVALAASIRLDTDQAAWDANGKWYASGFNMYLEQGSTSSYSNGGKENCRIEFARDTGNVNLKVNKNSVLLGQWTDPAGGMYAKDAWLDVLIEADIVAQTTDIYMNGSKIGTYNFNVNLSGSDALQQVRFMGPRNYTGFLNSGVSIDNVSLTTAPEPAGLALLAVGLLAIARRRIG